MLSVRTYTHEALTEDIEFLRKKYPFLRTEEIGSSVLGKKIYALFWGKGDKKILLNAAHHGSEWITSLLCMHMLERLSSSYLYGIKTDALNYNDLYKTHTLCLIPMINPDGVMLETGGFSSLPKDMQKTLLFYNEESDDFTKWQANIHGVDLNHNYDALFDAGVALQKKLGINSPGPTRFSGAHPESEPESLALATFTRRFLPDIALAYHSQGKVIYYDFNSLASKEAKKIAKKMADVSGYALDETSGMASFSGYKDWAIQTFGIPAFTIECGLGENPLPLSQFKTIFEDNYNMLLCLLNE